jgi:hypothetical protein
MLSRSQNIWHRKNYWGKNVQIKFEEQDEVKLIPGI